MRVSSSDGDQDLSMWMRDVEEVVKHALLVTTTSCLKQQWMRTASVCMEGRPMRELHSRLVK